MFAGLINQAKAAVAAFERRGGRDEEVVSAAPRLRGDAEHPEALSQLHGMVMADDRTDEVETEPLDKELQHTLEEARTVIPGLQALFGFQLIVPFHPTFKQLDGSLKLTHLGALIALALAIALIMTPAAYHRMVLRGKVSRSLIDFASRLIACAMAAFTMAIALNMFLIGSVVLQNELWGAVLGLLAFTAVAGLWFGYPMLTRK